MKILFLDAYFQPEQFAFTHLETDLIEGFVKAGHEIEIVCPTPTRGVSSVVAQEYKRIKTETLNDGHVHVTRFLAPKEGRNPLIRAIRYFWCNLRTYQIGKKRRIDAVFANSTPPTQGWVAGKVAKKLGVPFVYSLQDIFPDSLVTTGLTKNGSFLWKIGRILEKKTYNLCSIIVVISEKMKENLLKKGVNEDTIQLIPNWIDLDLIHPIPKDENSLFYQFNISREKFIVLYAGNFGFAQGADIVLDAAEMLQDETSILFVIFGSGVGYGKAEERAKTLPNVFMHPLLPQSRVAEVYSMGDVALITSKAGVGKSGMPSKTWSIMACNTPIIASFDTDSDLGCIIRDNNVGDIVPAESTGALVSMIRLYYSSRKTINSRTYVEKNASKCYCVGRYLSLFE